MEFQPVFDSTAKGDALYQYRHDPYAYNPDLHILQVHQRGDKLLDGKRYSITVNVDHPEYGKELTECIGDAIHNFLRTEYGTLCLSLIHI